MRRKRKVNSALLQSVLAGSAGVTVQPMDNSERVQHYTKQIGHGNLTARQHRRIRHAGRKMAGEAERAAGDNSKELNAFLNRMDHYFIRPEKQTIELVDNTRLSTGAIGGRIRRAAKKNLRPVSVSFKDDKVIVKIGNRRG